MQFSKQSFQNSVNVCIRYEQMEKKNKKEIKEKLKMPFFRC